MTERPERAEDGLSFVAPGPGAQAVPHDGGPAASAPVPGHVPGHVPAPDDLGPGPRELGARWGAPGGPTPAERAQARRRARIWVASVLTLVVLVVGTAAGVSAVVSAAHDRAWDPVAADVTEPVQVNAVQLVLGSCLAEVPDASGDDGGSGAGTVGTVEAVPCTTEHSGQVIGRTDADTAEVWPGDAALATRAARLCDPALFGPQAREAGLADDSTLVLWTPSEESWAAGDRTSLCVARFASPVTQSGLR